MQQQINEFLADLRLAGRAAGTASNHAGHLLRLARWCEAGGLEWAALSRRDLTVYVRGYASSAPSHVGNALCSLRTFYRWAVEQGYVSLSPAAHFKTPSKPSPLPRALSLGQVRVMLAFLRQGQGKRARRDEIVVLTGLYAGLRAKELVTLRWPDIDFDEGVITIELSKMGHGRAIPLHAGLKKMLLQWRELQALGRDVPCFSLGGQPLIPNRIGKIARRVRNATGLPLTAHVLRHTFATWALRRSKDLYGVSKALGHKQLKQTEVYVSVTVDDVRTAVDALPDMGSW